MNAVCLINNHNYRRYVGEAVESALEQTKPFAKIVVVDDGSTDGSVEHLRNRFGGEHRVEIVAKPQAGQLSCFNRGIGHAADADLVFFLDADDRYQPQYLAAAAAQYESRPEVDVLCVAPRPFGEGPLGGVAKRRRTRDLGVSVNGALFGGCWVGERTSCVSMRTATARRVLPYPREEDWITRADDVLVLGSSIVGAYKRRLEEPLVDYRVHGSNVYAGVRFDAATKLRRSLAINRLARWCSERSGYQVDRLPHFLHREFRTQQRPTPKEWITYLQLSLRARLPLSVRCRHLASMTHHFAKEWLRPSEPDKAADQAAASGADEEARPRAA